MAGRSCLSNVIDAVIRGHYSSQRVCNLTWHAWGVLSPLSCAVPSRYKNTDASVTPKPGNDVLGDEGVSPEEERDIMNVTQADVNDSGAFQTRTQSFFTKESSVERIRRPVLPQNGHFKKINIQENFRPGQFRFATDDHNSFYNKNERKRHDKFHRTNTRHDYAESREYTPAKIWPTTLSKDRQLDTDRVNPAGPDLLQIERGFHGWREQNDRPDILPGLGKRGKRPRSKESHHLRDLPVIKGEMLFGLHPVSLALKLGRREPYCLYVLDRGDNPQSDSVKEVMSLAEERNVPVKLLGLSQMDQCSSHRPHQGVCLDASSIGPLPYFDEEWDQSELNRGHLYIDTDVKRLPLWLVLYQVQDPMNFGAILRSAYLFGVNKVLKTRHKSCSLTPVVSKASTGVMEVLDIYSVNGKITDFIQAHQQKGWSVIGSSSGGCRPEGINNPGTESHPADGNDLSHLQAIPVHEFSFEKPTILILGNEGRGLPGDVLRACDQVVYAEVVARDADQYGLNSLNVSVATGIMLHCLTVLKGKVKDS